MELEVVTVAGMKNTLSRDVTPCSLLEIYCVGGSFCFHL
jgi:hypothetical protein